MHLAGINQTIAWVIVNYYKLCRLSCTTHIVRSWWKKHITLRNVCARLCAYGWRVCVCVCLSLSRIFVIFACCSAEVPMDLFSSLISGFSLTTQWESQTTAPVVPVAVHCVHLLLHVCQFIGVWMCSSVCSLTQAQTSSNLIADKLWSGWGAFNLLSIIFVSSNHVAGGGDL